jgi:hypothetical protein
MRWSPFTVHFAQVPAQAVDLSLRGDDPGSMELSLVPVLVVCARVLATTSLADALQADAVVAVVATQPRPWAARCPLALKAPLSPVSVYVLAVPVAMCGNALQVVGVWAGLRRVVGVVEDASFPVSRSPWSSVVTTLHAERLHFDAHASLQIVVEQKKFVARRRDGDEQQYAVVAVDGVCTSVGASSVPHFQALWLGLAEAESSWLPWSSRKQAVPARLRRCARGLPSSPLKTALMSKLRA